MGFSDGNPPTLDRGTGEAAAAVPLVLVFRQFLRVKNCRAKGTINETEEPSETWVKPNNSRI
jgi:hypothetical protein